MLEVVKHDEDNGIWHLTDYPAAAFVIKSRDIEIGEQLFKQLYRSLPPSDDNTEPMMNIIAWNTGNGLVSVVLPRGKHRPACYTAEGDAQFIISPGAVDMGGLIITPREQDFRRLTVEQVLTIYREVSITPEQVKRIIEDLQNTPLTANHSPLSMTSQPNVTVGIVSAQKIHFSLNGAYVAKGEIIQGEQTVEFS
jgi:hypothetical protein